MLEAFEKNALALGCYRADQWANRQNQTLSENAGHERAATVGEGFSTAYLVRRSHFLMVAAGFQAESSLHFARSIDHPTTCDCQRPGKSDPAAQRASLCIAERARTGLLLPFRQATS